MTRILIVDDKPENLYLLRALLQGHGYEVEEARHGAEALVKARAARPDLLISDLLMPVMDGYTLLRQWKLDARLGQIPFVVYTATYTEPKDEQLALDLGADAFILKPAEPDPFMARLDEVLGRQKRGELAVPRQPAGDEHTLLKEYSEVLIRKLETKMVELEQANRALTADIATRTQTESALRESEERLRLSTELAQVAVWEYHFADDSMARSSNHDRLYGLPWQEKWELNTFVQATHPDDRALTLAKIQEATAPGGPDDYTFDFRVRYPDQAIHWLSVIGQVMERSGAGQGMVVRGCLIDVSARKRAEAALRTSEENFRRIVETAEEGIWMIDAGAHTSFVNPKMAKMLGYPIEAMLGRALTDFMDEEGRALAAENLTRRRAGIAEQHDFKFLRENGTELWTLLATNPIFAADGTYAGALAMVTDITNRRETELKIKEQLRDLQQWYQNTLGREDRVRQLKREVNLLEQRLGEPPRYPSQEADPAASPPPPAP